MLKKKLKIVFVASEVSPFSKSGGLADVMRSLPKAVKRAGHEVSIITPLYGQVIDKKKYKLKEIFHNEKIYLNSKESIRINFWQGEAMDSLPIYFVECKKYFSRKKALYMSGHENARFLVFNVATLKLLSLLKYQADIINCHDWQTGLIPYYLKTDFRYSKTLKKTKTLFTIHNLIFQLGTDWWIIPPKERDNGRRRVPHLSDPYIEKINFAKRAILSANAISTVSEQYREEIMTRHYGQDLHVILKNRRKRLFGIVNGIDYADFNPNNDPGMHCNYNDKTFQKKKLNKAYLQKKFGLKVDSKIPLLCGTSRVTYQKGFELLLKIMDHLTGLNLQIIIMGGGDKIYIKEYKRIARKYPRRFVILPTHEQNQKYETLAFAGSDYFLLPSHMEPCGINQMKAMRYGCVPIVRKVGGLHDTVNNFNPGTGKGTGFVFKYFNEFSLYGGIVRALEAYKNIEFYNKLAQKVMHKSNSWEIPAKKYVSLYRKIMRFQNVE
ncbi:MAG: glycogen/starch synthase [Patescibacteria group bacterium]|nr:glycogen/starch synthase [Patescibacteria group bacterium]